MSPRNRTTGFMTAAQLSTTAQKKMANARHESKPAGPQIASDDVVDAAVAKGKQRWAELLRRLGE